MKKRWFAVALLAVAGVSFAAGRTTETTIGQWRNVGGSIDFSVVADANGKHADVWVSDGNTINTVMFFADGADLRRLQSLVVETIKELEHPAKP